jgi:Periplasmic protein involved in polysaccharide export
MQTGVEYWSAPTDLSGSIVRYQVDDVLNITVNAVEEPVIAADFNLPLQPLANTENSGEDNVPQGMGRQSYRVNRQGEIDFPVLGLIKVEGLTEAELEALLKESLKRYLKAVPIISIRMQDFRISVLGEVGRPGQYNVTKNNINIFEALSLAGDMSIYGQRDKVKLMRVLPVGETHIIELDLTNPEIVSSPYFFLQQNDVLYVKPNKTRAKSSGIGQETNILISVGSILISVASLIVMIGK